ncbi:MAG: sulfite exporter TauE/SafE family protein [Chlorobiaceae bacterium]|nr:sulfite exporter TauE/SafE family protein [Chlorobiaceae bacterium]
MISIFFAMLLSGLAGGFGHCIGMCGPLVCAFFVGEKETGAVRHILFHLGRITTYSLLGGFAGLSGSFLILAASIEKFQTIVLVIAGLFVILMGLATAEWLPLKNSINACTPLLPLIRKTMDMFKGPRSAGTYYPMGIVLGFLPCGLSYTALLAAMRTAMETDNRFTAMLTGAFMMFLFGIGTAPALVLVGKTVHIIGEKVRKRLYRIASLIMIVTGISFIVSALK